MPNTREPKPRDAKALHGRYADGPRGSWTGMPLRVNFDPKG